MSTAGSPQLRNLATHAALAPAALPVTLIDFPVAAALPPIGHSRFCLRYPDDCTVHGIDFRRRNIALTPQRWNELNGINREVNRNISPETTPGTGATEKWAISPPTGDCKAYAITKRHALLARGWPSRSLLLSEVVLPSGEHHLVLVVRLKGANLVLDNLSDDMRLLTTSFDYQWVRIRVAAKSQVLDARPERKSSTVGNAVQLSDRINYAKNFSTGGGDILMFDARPD